VLVNTAGDLQSRAADTGADAQAQVSNQIDVISATGDVNSGGVESIELVVKKSPGSDAINLSEATIQYTSDSAAATLGNDTTGTIEADGSVFVFSEITGNGNGIIDDTGERYNITISTTDIEGTGENLAAGSDADLQIVDQSGASTTYGVNVPDVLSGDYVEV